MCSWPSYSNMGGHSTTFNQQCRCTGRPAILCTATLDQCCPAAPRRCPVQDNMAELVALGALSRPAVSSAGLNPYSHGGCCLTIPRTEKAAQIARRLARSSASTFRCSHRRVSNRRGRNPEECRIRYDSPSPRTRGPPACEHVVMANQHALFPSFHSLLRKM